jgi:hypothetical protein
MMRLCITALLAAAAPAAAQTVETASGDWSNIPEMRHQVGATIDADVITAIAGLIDRNECTIAGQRHGRLDMSVPFLVQFKADGSIDRLVVHSVGCPRAEGLLAGEMLRLVRNGGFAPTGDRREGWFRGQLSFSHLER